MERYPRLSRSQVIARLKSHAAEHGHASNISLHAHDKVLLRSIPLHFVGVAAAREAAGVSGPPYQKPRAKTGPKPGGPFGRRAPIWSKARVIDELRRIHREGERTSHADLVKAGLLSLIGAAYMYVGGLRRARELAGIATPPPRRSKRRYDETRVVTEIKARHRADQSLASSLAPQKLVTAGRWYFKSWANALRAAGVDPDNARIPRKKKYTRDYILARLRHEAKAGSDLRALSLAKTLKLEAVRREFGTLRAALVAAGLGGHLQRRKHGLQKWSRERVIEVLQERAAKREHTLTPGLHRVVQLYFGGAEAARAAAGVPSPVDLRRVHGRVKSAENEQARRGAGSRARRASKSRR